MALITLRPVDHVSDVDHKKALRSVTWQGITGTAMYSVVNNGLLVAYALALGANNFQIGILAALPFVGQPLQVAAMYAIDRFRLRKVIALLCWAPAQAVWLLMAFIPLLIATPSGAAVVALLALMGVRSILISAVTTSWNSWIRDLVPQQTMGGYFSRRLAVSTFAAVAFGLAGAFAIDIWGARATAEDQVLGYSGVLAIGAVTLGFASVVFMSRVPEPRMPESAGQLSLRKSLATPLQDPGYKFLVWFLAAWSFASSLAIPFFTVHMLVRLEFSLPLVIGLMALSQVVMAVFYRTWGSLADHYSFKAVLSLCGSLYLLVILGWTFTGFPGPHSLSIPLVVVLLIFAGIASAGMNLAVETIGLKLAPAGNSTPYLVAASLATSLGAALGPLAGGQLVDFFNVREVTVVVGVRGPEGLVEWPTLYLVGFDFLFVAAFLLGLPTLALLGKVHESGELSSDVVLDEFFSQGPGFSRAAGLVPGLGLAASIPYSYLRRVPGVNVGLGVTLYELRSATRTVAQGLQDSRRFASRLNIRLRRRLLPMLRDRPIENQAVEIANAITGGVVESADVLEMSAEELAVHAIQGTATVMVQAGTPAEEALRAAAQGAAQALAQTGADVGQIAAGIIEAARSAGEDLGLSPESATRTAVEGVIEAAKGSGQDGPKPVI